MPKKINYGAMFVFPYKKNPKDYNAQFLLIWDEQELHTKFFSHKKYTHPKIAAHHYVETKLKEYYGTERADYIVSIPQFVKYFRFGCGVGIYEGTQTTRGVVYPRIIIYWSERVYEYGKKPRLRRRQKTLLYNEFNRIDRQHEASLFAARKRADLTFSNLSADALNFDYDLDFIRGLPPLCTCTTD